MRLALLGVLLLPSQLPAQFRQEPLALASPRLLPGNARGELIGFQTQDTGYLAKLPRLPIGGGTARYAVEVDTLDFRSKWTLHLRFPRPDTLELILRFGDSLPPGPGVHKAMIIATGTAQARNRFAGEVIEWDSSLWQHYSVRSAGAWILLDTTRAGQVAGSVVLWSERLDATSPAARRSPIGIVRNRGIEAVFTARATPPSSTRAITALDEERIMMQAIDGLIITWSDAVNSDRAITSPTPEGVRAFLMERWGHVLAVDSVSVRGHELWIRLRGLRFGHQCAQGPDDIYITCEEH